MSDYQLMFQAFVDAGGVAGFMLGVLGAIFYIWFMMSGDK